MSYWNIESFELIHALSLQLNLINVAVSEGNREISDQTREQNDQPNIPELSVMKLRFICL